MRIGILTLQGASNYGAVLQATALSDFLKSMGYETEVINFYTPEVYGFYDYHIFSKPLSPRSILSKALRRKRNEREWRAFEAFRAKALSFSSRCVDRQSFSEIASQYDAVICGSDQVWNPKANGGHMDEYCLSPIDGSKVKKISFAASFGTVGTVEGREAQIKDYLSDFTALSVREDEAASYLRSVVGRPVERLVDPSLLMDARYYERFEALTSTPGRYLLTYMLNGSEGLLETVQSLSARTGLPVISLGKRVPGSRLVKDIGPAEYLYLVHHAEAFVTNSFHGTAFALIYGTPFLTFGNGCYNSRMRTLLSIAGEGRRFCNDGAEAGGMSLLEISPDPAFTSKIEAEREKAQLFLRAALEASTTGTLRRKG